MDFGPLGITAIILTIVAAILTLSPLIKEGKHTKH